MVLLFRLSCVRLLYLNIPRTRPSTKILRSKQIHVQPTRASTMVAHGYEEAIVALNGLQSNAVTIQNIRLRGDTGRTQLPATIKYLERAGITLDVLDRLSVIHVTGTKGKGSTCAFTERILRQYGYKTGLYTSPHLVSVTERIRIDGQPIHRDEYTKHFWHVYNALYCKRENPNDMPAYFKFLTVMAMKIFLEERVDVAVMEVGIGGEYDCTNAVRNPVVCGITALDLDHTSLLGNTLESIAWHKAGIIKAGAGVYTVQGHQPEALRVIEERAALKQCKVLVCPNLEQYSSGVPLELGLAGHVQKSNASLALQLARYWLNNSSARNSAGGRLITSVPPAPVPKGEDRCAPAFVLTDQETRALKNVVWPGRSQVFPVDEKFTFFLDGAHTSQSMEACARWFLEASAARLSPHQDGKCVRVLWFNSTGDRDVQTLLRRLLCCHFDLALFTSNSVSHDPKFSDQINWTVSGRSVLLRCRAHLETWQFLYAARGAAPTQQSQSDREEPAPSPRQHQSKDHELQKTNRDDRRLDTDSQANTSGDTNCSNPLGCVDIGSRGPPGVNEFAAEECSVVGGDGAKSVVHDGEKMNRLHSSLVGAVNANLSDNRCGLDSSKSIKSKSSVATISSDMKSGRENSLRSSSLPNSNFSLDSQCDDGCVRKLKMKNSQEKRRSNVLQENVLPSREAIGRESFSERSSTKESKLDLGYNFSETDRKSSCQNEMPVSRVNSSTGTESDKNELAGRHTERSVSLPPDSGNHSPTEHMQSISLDRTHMLQLVSADDECNSTSDAAVVIPYIEAAMKWLRCGRPDMRRCFEDHQKFAYDSSIQEALAEADHVHVLVTGSLHLVGGVLAVLDPSLTKSVPQKRPVNVRKVLYSSPGTP